MEDIKKVQTQQAPTAAEPEQTRNRRIYSPRVDIFEKEGAIVLKADMPGTDEKNINISLEKNILTITGEVDVEHRTDLRLGYAEYGVGDYSRSFSVPDDIDRNRIEATVKNGVLRLVLPKAEPEKARRIEIKAA
ncbi:MAG: Hsp20/alpha crystallin family protein [Syntrophaceae bacterium]|jgi:HSP20 family molecular chaperone IbpA